MVFGILTRRLVPFLLATSNPTGSGDGRVTSSQTYGGVVNRLRETYNDLASDHVPLDVSPTVRFSFVPPPSSSSASSSATTNSNLDGTNSTSTESLFGADDLIAAVAAQHKNSDDNDDDSSKPIAVYLPGLDCFGLSGFQQFEELSKTFEFWRMTVTTTDRSSFTELSDLVVDFLTDLSMTTGTQRPIVLIGESFGGLLAPAVAMKLQGKATRSGTTSPLSGLVLVNPATSYDDTQWDLIGPSLATIDRLANTVNREANSRNGATPYTVSGGLLLSALIPDSTQFQQILDALLGASTDLSLAKAREFIEALDSSFGVLGERLPSALVEHRVTQWMNVGSAVMTEKRLSKLDVTTLVVAGDDDKFLPSKNEADRLVRIMPSTKKLIVPGAGHFVLDSRVNLTEAILYSDIDPLGMKVGFRYDPITDWKLPSPEEVESTIESRVKPLRQLTSPIFYSTDDSGKRWKGLGQLPSDGPLVFVANHQLIGLDLGLIIAELLEQRNISARGLAHPFIFQGSEPELPGQPVNPGLNGPDRDPSNNPFSPRVFQKFGAVMVTPRNYYRLLQTGQDVLLFPGGVREVFHRKGEEYHLFWPDQVDFVRTAARFNATVVPLSAVGSSESFNILLDSDELVNLPFVGEGLRQSSANRTSARFNQDNDQELFQTPLAVPKIPPARHYFVFGKAMKTDQLDYNDKVGCKKFYRSVKEEVERGFDDILKSRPHDPYKDSTARIAVEQVTGKQAPTFGTEELNKRL